MMSTTNRIVGLLLAGGQSRRMGGGDKGMLPLGDKPMLAHVIDRLSPQVDRLVINANGDPIRFEAFQLPVVADSLDGFQGPLAGVLAGLKWAKANASKATHVASVSTDAPFVPLDLVARLDEGRTTENTLIALAASGGHLHPVIGLWPIDLADDLEQALADGVRKVLAWTDRHGVATVSFSDLEIGGEAIDPFFNANTPEDLDVARRLLQKIPPQPAP
jgi:molybdenum cofactor guanylyltransferase